MGPPQYSNVRHDIASARWQPGTWNKEGSKSMPISNTKDERSGHSKMLLQEQKGCCLVLSLSAPQTRLFGLRNGPRSL